LRDHLGAAVHGGGHLSPFYSLYPVFFLRVTKNSGSLADVLKYT
jgi:hypothetical protein